MSGMVKMNLRVGIGIAKQVDVVQVAILKKSILTSEE
jgi:hypothetical protein